MKLPGALLSSSSINEKKKKKKKRSEKILIFFQKSFSHISSLSLQNFSSKRFFIFFSKRTCSQFFFTFSLETELFCSFSKENFSYISGNGNPQAFRPPPKKKKKFIFYKTKLAYISGSNFPSLKNKKNPL